MRNLQVTKNVVFTVDRFMCLNVLNVDDLSV